MPNRPSEVRKETFGHEALFDCKPLITTPETDGFSYSPAMDAWYHGIKVEDYAHLGRDPEWFTPGTLIEQLYDLPRAAGIKNIFEYKTSPSADPTRIAVTEAEAIHLGRHPRRFSPEGISIAQLHREAMKFPPFEKVPTPPELWRIADTYGTTILRDHRVAITMLRHAMFFFESTPSKAKNEHKVELAKTIRTEVWRPMINAAAVARNWTKGQEKMVLDALDSKLFFIGKSTERKKVWKLMLDLSEGYVINKQRLFAQFSKK